MNERQLYVRVRGKVTGPFGLQQLKSLRDRGQFRRFHEVSEDRRSWAPASSIQELFPENVKRTEEKPDERFSDAQTARVTRQAGDKTAKEEAEQWYYVDGEGNETGPVSRER